MRVRDKGTFPHPESVSTGVLKGLLPPRGGLHGTIWNQLTKKTNYIILKMEFLPGRDYDFEKNGSPFF
jgi:hypothetical protein